MARVRAGSKLPVKFLLTGAEPMVDTQPVDCTTRQPTGEAPIVLATPGYSGVQQDGDLYQINWSTDASWKGTCRAVTVRIPAASDAIAYVDFH
jgi:hypothetical protein